MALTFINFLRKKLNLTRSKSLAGLPLDIQDLIIDIHSANLTCLSRKKLAFIFFQYDRAMSLFCNTLPTHYADEPPFLVEIEPTSDYNNNRVFKKSAIWLKCYLCL